MVKIYLCRDELPDKSGLTNIKKVKDRLMSMRCDIIDPQENKPPSEYWQGKLNQRIELLKNSQVIYVLPGWKESVISRIELTIAMDMKLHTLFHPVSNKEIRKLITTLND